MSLELFMNDVITVQQPRMKICTQCKTPKPATAEYFYCQASYRGGLISICKECKGVCVRSVLVTNLQLICGLAFSKIKSKVKRSDNTKNIIV